MPGDNDNQNLTDEQILAKLQEQEESDLPGEGEEPAQDEREKKIRHAFAEKKRAAKQALDLANKYKAELEAERKKSTAGATQPNAGATTPPVGSTASRQIITALTMRAMSNLGISEVTTDEERSLVALEMQRLYSVEAGKIESRRLATAREQETVAEQLEKYPSLDDAAKVEIRKRLSELDILERTDPKRIHDEVSRYVGETLLAGGEVTPPSRETRERATSAAAAASSVRTTGRPGAGVKPGTGAENAQPKPPTPEEQTLMRRHNFTDVKALRAAMTRKENYKVH
ncbi:MAG: hypothetical protein WC822_01510 [Candidatus Paceibacterota bacterium]